MKNYVAILVLLLMASPAHSRERQLGAFLSENLGATGATAGSSGESESGDSENDSGNQQMESGDDGNEMESGETMEGTSDGSQGADMHHEADDANETNDATSSAKNALRSALATSILKQAGLNSQPMLQALSTPVSAVNGVSPTIAAAAAPPILASPTDLLAADHSSLSGGLVSGAVPEPASSLLLASAAFTLLYPRRRGKKGTSRDAPFSSP
jgi:hypothetical protein